MPVNDIALFAPVRSLARLKQMMDELRIRQAASGDGSLLTEAELEIDGGLTDAKILLADASDTLAGKVRSYLAEDGHQTEPVKTVREAMARAQDELGRASGRGRGGQGG